MKKIKVNNYLAIALITLLGSSVLAIQLSTNIFSLPNLLHDQHSAEGALLPLAIDYHYTLKEKVGDAKSGSTYVKIDENFIDSENHCEFCTRIEIIPGPQGEIGLAYALDKVLDLSNAKSVTFGAMGEKGGEKVKFKVAGKKLDKTDSSLLGPFKNHKFAKTTAAVSLGNDWKKYEIDLRGVDLTGISYPFGLEMSTSGLAGKPQVIYIKNIIYNTPIADNPLATVQQ